MATVKINTTFQVEMAARIDNYCKTKGMTRSSFLSMAATQYLDAVEKQPIISDAFGNMGDLVKLALAGKADTPEYAAKLAALQGASESIKK